MSTTRSGDDRPFMQRLYDNVWLLALLALVFFTVSYVGWGLLDIFTVPLR
ncbi:hypothetical protein [Halovivax limisalsi]|nr:hypothetical protein [Halovivax limisalsi]